MNWGPRAPPSFALRGDAVITTIRRIAATTAAAAVLSAVGATAFVEPAQAWVVNTASDGGYDVYLEYYEILQIDALGLNESRTSVARQWCTAMADRGVIP